MVRVQVLMKEKEREEFRSLAESSGMSLSAWLRRAGVAQADRQNQARRLGSPAALREFFDKCDEREQGHEPDWQEHERVIQASQRSGDSGT